VGKVVTTLYFWASDVRWLYRRPYFLISSLVVVVDTPRLLGSLLRVGDMGLV
jgi:hypothetical protein